MLSLTHSSFSGSGAFGATRVSEAHQLSDGSHATAADPQFGKSVKDMPRSFFSPRQDLPGGPDTHLSHLSACRSLLLLLKNPTFIFLCLAGATEATLVAGMSTFGPKFLESQLGLSASEAATWFGGSRFSSSSTHGGTGLTALRPPPRLHGGPGGRRRDLPGRLHCEAVEHALSRDRAFVHDVHGD